MLRTVMTMLCLLGLTTFSAGHATEMYRWIDTNGVLNYSQVKPEGIQSEKVVTRGSVTSSEIAPASGDPAAQPGQSGPKLTPEQQQKLAELKALHEEEQQKVAEVKQANCEKSRKVLERLKLKDVVRVRENDGSERIIGEDERQRRIDDAQLGIATNCT